MEDVDLSPQIETDNAPLPQLTDLALVIPEHLKLANSFPFEEDDEEEEEEEDDTKSTISITDLDHQQQKVETSVGQVNINSCSGVHIGNQAYYNGDVTIQQYVLNAKDALNALPGNITDIKDGVKFLEATSLAAITDSEKGGNENFKSLSTKLKSRYIWCGLVVLLLIIGITATLLVIYPPYGDVEDWDSEVSENSSLRLYTREDWQAQPAQGEVIALKQNPPHYVIIAHTTGSNCSTFPECSQKVRDIQFDHMGRGWGDIGMHFLVGGDGAAYTGLGWGKHGAHTIPFNARSIAIYFIGNFMFQLPPKRQIRAAKLLIEEGVKMGKIAPDYKLFAHKQVWPTESPGAALIQDIKKWPHWATYEVSDD